MAAARRAQLLAACIGSAACADLIGIEPWDADTGGQGGGAAIGAGPGGPSSGSAGGAGGEDGGGSGPTTSITATSGATGPGGGADPSASTGSSSSGSCGALDDCEGVCRDCLGGGCLPGSTTCAPVLLGSTSGAADDDHRLLARVDGAWLARGSDVYDVPLDGDGDITASRETVAGAVVGLAATDAALVVFHPDGFATLPRAGGALVERFTPEDEDVVLAGTATAAGRVFVATLGGGQGKIIEVGEDGIAPELVCTSTPHIPRVLFLLGEADLYAMAANLDGGEGGGGGPAQYGGFLRCVANTERPGVLTSPAGGIDRSCLRAARLAGDRFVAALGDPAAATHGLQGFSETTAPSPASPLLPDTIAYDVAALGDHVIFTARPADRDFEAVRAIHFGGRAPVELARCTGGCKAVAVDGTVLYYSTTTGEVWARQLDGVDVGL